MTAAAPIALMAPDAATWHRLAGDLALAGAGWPAAAETGGAGVLAIAPGVASGAEQVRTALAQGRRVVWTAPDALRALTGLGDGAVAAPGRLGCSEVGAYLTDELHGTGVGRPLSFCLTLHAPASAGGFEALLWDAVCLIDQCLGLPLQAVQVSGGALFGPRRDTAVVLARDADGCVVTADIACSLPPTAPPDAAVEIMGTTATLRAAPHDRRVRWRSAAPADATDRADAPRRDVPPRDLAAGDVFWGEDPVVATILAGLTPVPGEAEALRRRLDLALAILDALDAQDGGAADGEVRA